MGVIGLRSVDGCVDLKQEADGVSNFFGILNIVLFLKKSLIILILIVGF